MGSSGGPVAGLILILGIIILLANLLVTNTAWDDLSAAVQNTPSFNNPFDATESTGGVNDSFVPIGDLDITEGGAFTDPQFSGCEESAFHLCINTNDGNRSFVRFNFTTAAREMFLYFNLTPPGVYNIEETTVAGYTIEISCRTLVNSTRAPFFSFVGVRATDPPLKSLSTGGGFRSCPYGEGFTLVTISDFSGGYGGDFEEFVNGFHSFLGASNFAFFDPEDDGIQPEHGATPEAGTLDVSFVRISIVLTTGLCRAPDGAWFPWAEEVACAIGNFGNTIWNGIVFVFNGLVYVGSFIVYLGGILLGVIGLFAVLFDLGAPSPFQEIVDIAVITMMSFIVIFVVLAVRGGEG